MIFIDSLKAMFALAVLSIAPLSALSEAASCSLCSNGGPISFPQKKISIQGFEFVDDCKALADIAPQIFQQESDECKLLQSIGTFCGCAKPVEACDLCADDSTVAYGGRKLEFLAESFGGIIPTCELVEAGLHSYNNTDDYCTGSQLILSEYCGCGITPGSQPVALPEDKKCTLCLHGELVPMANKTIDIVGFPIETCGELEKAAYTLFEDKEISSDGADVVERYLDNKCILMRQLSVHCGCPQPIDVPCPICKVDNTYEVPYPDTILDTSLTNFFLRDIEISCGVLQDIAMTWSTTRASHRVVCGTFARAGHEMWMQFAGKASM